jgi:hypothetical protein
VRAAGRAKFFIGYLKSILILVMPIKVIVTGATGMVGEGVLLECLHHPEVESVLIVNRKVSGFTHSKLKEIVHKDFFDLSTIKDQLKGYDACYFCLGVSVIGMKEAEYYRITHELTLNFATTLAQLNPQMCFCYVSGAGTDSSEKGRIMWARIKGKTENDLMKLPFRTVFAFRPGVMQATKGQKNTLTAYKYLSWMFYILKVVAPNAVLRLSQVGRAMINVTLRGYSKNVLEIKDISLLSGEKL